MGWKDSVPSGFMVSVPSGSVTGVPTAMGCPLTSVMVSGSFSGSASFDRGSKVSSVSSGPVTASGLATGGSLMESTVRLTVAVSVVVPSVTV